MFKAPGLSNRGDRLLALDYAALAPGRVGRVGTAVFVPSAAVSEHFEGPGYNLFASPQLYPGQTIRARVLADNANSSAVAVGVYVQHYNREDGLETLVGVSKDLSAGQTAELEWQVPDLEGYPIANVGIQISGDGGASGRVNLDWLDLGWRAQHPAETPASA